jgi:hypothetical protein
MDIDNFLFVSTIIVIIIIGILCIIPMFCNRHRNYENIVNM